MFDVVFPQKNAQHYWDIHYEYILNILRYIGCNIFYRPNLDIDNTSFRCIINNKTVIFDFSDSSEVRDLGNSPIFKFHLKAEDLDKAIPFSPVSFYDWNQYYQLEKEIRYNPLSSFDISCRQRPYAGALLRRQYVQSLLLKKFPHLPNAILIDLINQTKYWEEINTIELAVFVPGFSNNTLDRGHLQYMAFGCFTISPNIPELLPFNKELIPGEHYIQCKEDYTDLTDIILKLRVDSNQTKYKKIGDNAKKLFLETSTPEKLGEWINIHL